MKRFLSAMLSLAMMATMSTAAFAADTEYTANQVYDTDGALNKASSQITTKVVKTADVLVATVPTEIPVVFNTKGEVTIPENLKIVNNSDKTIALTDITVKTANNEILTSPGGITWINENPSLSGYRAYYYAFNSYTPKNLTNFTLNTSTGLYNIATVSKESNCGSINLRIEPNAEYPLQMKVAASKAVYQSQKDTSQVGTVTFTLAYV